MREETRVYEALIAGRQASVCDSDATSENTRNLAAFCRILRDREYGQATTPRRLDIIDHKFDQLALELAAMLA